ncbi:flavodoxin domain-containing protein [Streptomyces sp. NBC_01381]|uniref:flavodoxin domain-containing protein n=1 Tax=Streptomyces sp. NBC_01381 TaxID=2903845 RepID=UPI00225873AD|nr:flavodoxin domain-containing protein [Streptomyces sp. NBC_01381]MCX4672376.1 flavodoxin domain-containing protein [Streptomyces sp. NBC_01381]
MAYATVHGSTREIAERLGARLDEAGLDADVRPMKEVHDEDAYEAFVLCSAVHGQEWLPEAREFLRRNSELLRVRPVWIFSVGMPDSLRGPWKRMAHKEEPVIAESLPGHVPYRRHWLMSGVIRPAHLPLAGRVLFRLMGCRYGDYRDWTALNGRAEEIARGLVGPAERH